MRNRTKHAALCVVAGVCLPTVSQAKSPVDLGVAYTADTVTTISGGADHNARFLDNVDVTADVDLDALVGWSGATVHVDVLNNMGLRPNEAVGSVEGVNNIEVQRRHLKLYEAWIEQQIGKSLSVRAGLYNLNSEFYVTEASDLLIGPAFGIGSELSGTGVNGPSIFPSTALAARVHVAFGKTGYVQAAVINADARTWGDPGGIDTRFDNGVLMIAEAGTGDRLRLSVGAWRYSQRANDAFWLDVNGNPLRRRVEGVYGLAQWTV